MKLCLIGGQLFAQNATEHGLNINAPLALDMFAQRLVNQGLVVSSTTNAVAEPLDDVRVETDRDPLFGILTMAPRLLSSRRVYPCS